MLRALQRTIVQFLTDPRLWLILLASGIVSLGCFAGVWWSVRRGIGWIATRWPQYAGWLEYGQGVLGFLTALLLFPATFVLVAGLFQERVADAVEARHYRHAGPARGAPMLTSLLASMRFFVIAALVNVIALPLYLGMMWLAGSGVLLMLAVNGMLAGREYYEIVALRRLSRAEMDASRRRHRLPLFLAGVLIAALGLVPLANLLAPVAGIALMVHVFHSGPGRNLPPPAPPA